MKKIIALTLIGLFSLQNITNAEVISNESYLDTTNKIAYSPEESSVKANMHTIQTMLETYAVDWYGHYPEKLEELQKESKKLLYWKPMKNPFTEMSGLGKNGFIMDYKTYKNYKPHPSLKGLVLYEPINSKFEKEYKKSLCVKYNLYGTDKNGELLKDKYGNIFLLNNS